MRFYSPDAAPHAARVFACLNLIVENGFPTSEALILRWRRRPPSIVITPYAVPELLRSQSQVGLVCAERHSCLSAYNLYESEAIIRIVILANSTKPTLRLILTLCLKLMLTSMTTLGASADQCFALSNGRRSCPASYSQSLEAECYFRRLHEEPPEEPRAVVLDHRHDRPLIYG